MDRYKRGIKYIVPLRKKYQLLILIIVCTLVLLCQPIAVANKDLPGNVFDYVSSPNINLINEEVLFKCVFSPFSTPDNVTVYILDPELNSYEFQMVENHKKQFINISSFFLTGRYSFFIYAEDDDQIVYSISRSFWITSSLSDKDNDKMDDAWEQFYGFDNLNPKDAFYDVDKDGFKNLDEFTLGTDPLDADYIEFVLYNISSQFHYILFTVSFLLIALLCSLFGLRRSTRWI